MSECTACGDKPKNTAKDFTKAVIEINNPEQLVLLRKVVVPSSLGDDEENPAAIGRYRNVILQYEANNHIYLYSSDGIPTYIETEIPKELLDRIDNLEAEDIILHGAISDLGTALGIETSEREAADTALSTAISNEATARRTADDTLAEAISSEATARQTADENLSTAIGNEATARANADSALDTRVTAIEGKIPAAATTQNQLADKDFVNSSIATNTATFRGTYNLITDLNLTTAATENQVAAALASTVVTAENNDYSFVQVPTSDSDPTEIARVDRYKYNGTAWEYEYSLNNSSFTAAQWAAINSGITSEAVAKLTNLANIKSIGANLALDANGELSATDTTYTAGTNVQISAANVISATDTTYTAGTGLSLNGTLFSVDTSVIAEVSDIPTRVSQLSNDSGYQTASDVATAISGKQDTLTAGAGISIVNNVISANSINSTDWSNLWQ